MLGPTGVGKSFHRLRAGAESLPRRPLSSLHAGALRLFRDLALARADGSFRTLLARLSRIDVLVIDDWAMAPLYESRAPRLLGDLRGSLSSSLYRSHFATAGLALARTDRRSHHRRRHPRPSGPQRPSHRDARRVHAKKPQPTQGSKPGMIHYLLHRGAGAKGLLPLSPAPQIPADPASASLRTISLDDSEHLLHNHHASVASLRLLFTFAPECRSASLRNRCSPSPEYPDR